MDFYHVWAWRPFRSYDPDTLKNVCHSANGCSTSNLALIGQAVLERMFDYIKYIHVYSPG